MPLYFLLLDPARFHQDLAPVLASCRRARSFDPARSLAEALLPAARGYAARFHTGADEPLLSVIARGLPFERSAWRLLVGEVLLYAAEEVPEVVTAPDTLRCLIAPDAPPRDTTPREHWPFIDQAHFGARDLSFAGGFYRPDAAGLNDVADVARLCRCLEAVDLSAWSAAALASLPDLAGPEEQADELAYAQENAFPALRDLYRQTHDRGQIVVCEEL